MLEPTFIRQRINIAERNARNRRQPPLGAWAKKRLVLRIRWLFACDIRLLERNQAKTVVVLNGLMLRRSIFAEAARTLHIACLYMENGWLPDTTACDQQGVNFLSSVPRNAEYFLALRDLPAFKPAMLEQRQEKTPKKKNMAVLPENFIFVPFQVDYDTQIILFSDWIQNMEQLFTILLDACRDTPYQLVFKEHPSSVIDYSYLHHKLSSDAGIFANDYSTQELIEKAAAVVTINSTVGIESLIFSKKLIVLGQAFYSLDTLVLAADNAQALHKAIHSLPSFTVNEALRVAFLQYLQHVYLVAGSWKKATPEHLTAMVQRISQLSNEYPT